MKIGIPKEVKPKEGRVGLVPNAAAEMVKAGHTVTLQSGAGVLSGYDDSHYAAVGVNIAPDAKALFQDNELIIKVKEPYGSDLELLQAKHILFCYLHLAPNPVLTKRLLDIQLTAVAYETVEHNGHLPLLAPMSEIAGRVAVDAGSHYLHQSMGGKGVLLGGIPGTERGNVVVIGGGVAGRNAAIAAAGMGALVEVFDKSAAALHLADAIGPNVTALYAYQESIAAAMTTADLVIGAVLVPGAKAPALVSRAMVKAMQPGSVIVDISIDQGGCIETMRPTDYNNPVYLEEGVIHMGVTNLPGAVPRTSAQALSGAVLPYALALAEGRLQTDQALQKGLNVQAGKLIYPALKDCFDF